MNMEDKATYDRKIFLWIFLKDYKMPFNTFKGFTGIHQNQEVNNSDLAIIFHDIVKELQNEYLFNVDVA